MLRSAIDTVSSSEDPSICFRVSISSLSGSPLLSQVVLRTVSPTRHLLHRALQALYSFLPSFRAPKSFIMRFLISIFALVFTSIALAALIANSEVDVDCRSQKMKHPPP